MRQPSRLFMLLPMLLLIAAADLKPYKTLYHTIYTDLDEHSAQEAVLRMTTLAEELNLRTGDFAGRVTEKLPFYLYRSRIDYHRAGGPVGSSGYYDGGERVLKAVAGDEADAETWRVVQHEAFHQFAEATIGTNLPIWVNEGMAEYFGMGVWTGDGFQTGLIPPWRLKRIRDGINDDSLPSIETMLRMSHETWNQQLSINNYDMAWAMSHFLAHGDDGKYQKAFGRYIAATGRGVAWRTAWKDQFGGNIDQFDAAFKRFWLDGEDPTRSLRGQTVVAMLTSVYARSVAAGQSFDGMDLFLKAADKEKTESIEKDWIPPSLGRDAARAARELESLGGKFSMQPGRRGRVNLVLELDGETIEGSWTSNGMVVRNVLVAVK